MLAVGIVGLPNVGKSSLFNALAAGQAEVSNYPFTTIDSNIGMVAVPDHRLAELEQLLQPEKTTPCFIRFIDIAGLVKGASQGEGLGNQFLGEIRQVDAIVHVLRCFNNPDVVHVFAEVDPVRDAEIVQTELLLADLEVLNRAIAKRQRDWQTHPRQYGDESRRLCGYRETLERGVPLGALDLDDHARSELKAIGLLTGKPLLYVANVAEEAVGANGAIDPQWLGGQKPPAEVVAITASLEWELQQLEPADRAEFMHELGIKETGLDRLVGACFGLLGLITFFTIVKGKLQAWEIIRGTTAHEAAGKIHSDIKQGFIRAQVASLADLLEHGSPSELRSQGLIRTVGKEYEVRDGDVIEFLFNPPKANT